MIGSHDVEATRQYGQRLARLADDAADAIRAINHATITQNPLPAPGLYNVLGSLNRVGYGLDQALTQLGDRLAESADVFDLYEDDGSDPAASITAARSAMALAAEHARALGSLLDSAHSAIARQGYRA